MIGRLRKIATHAVEGYRLVCPACRHRVPLAWWNELYSCPCGWRGPITALERGARDDFVGRLL